MILHAMKVMRAPAFAVVFLTGVGAPPAVA